MGNFHAANTGQAKNQRELLAEDVVCLVGLEELLEEELVEVVVAVELLELLEPQGVVVVLEAVVAVAVVDSQGEVDSGEVPAEVSEGASRY